MNARELHDHIAEYGLLVAITHYKGDDTATILRALDLFARVEESTDELVRELRECQNSAHIRWELFDEAAATILALKAERDALRQHAEAMAQLIRMFTWMDKHGVQLPAGLYAQVSEYEAAVLAYRRDFPKDAP